MSLHDVWELEVDDAEMLWKAMKVISTQEFETNSLLSLWPEIKDKERARILARMRREADKVQGVSRAKRLSNEDLKAELSGG